MKTLYVGDVHGCSVELLLLLKKFGFKKGEDKLYLTGDLIDKGYNNLRVLDIVREYGGKSVMGNHEQYFINMFKVHKDREKFAEAVQRNFSNYEIKTTPEEFFFDRFHLRDFKDGQKIYDYIKTLPLHIRTDDGILVHAGVDPKASNYRQTSRELFTTIRRLLDGKPWFKSYTGKDRVIFGHWAAQNYLQEGNVICLDSGCVYGYKLTGWCPEEDKFYQVNSTVKEKWPIAENREAKKVEKKSSNPKTLRNKVIATIL